MPDGIKLEEDPVVQKEKSRKNFERKFQVSETLRNPEIRKNPLSSHNGRVVSFLLK